ncbi:MAG: EamA family transporter [Bacteroidaceae bacterium]|nr:EamA family transporter [Bacteroidaceae bacterium]
MDSAIVKGYTFGIIGSACYGLNPLFALPLYKAGMGPDSVLFFRYAFAIGMLAVLMKVRGCSFALKKQEVLPLMALGILFSLSSLTLFESYNYLDAGIASTILFLYPLMVAVIMALFFHERAGMLTFFAIVLSFVGISMLSKGVGGQTINLFGVGLVVISSLTYAIYIVWVNRSNVKHMPTEKLTFYSILFGISIYVARTGFLTVLQVPPTPLLWMDALSLAFFPTMIALVFITFSIHYIGSTPASILGALEPVTALCCGVMVFGEQLTLRNVLGIFLVLASVMLIVAARPLTQLVKRHIPHHHGR